VYNTTILGGGGIEDEEEKNGTKRKNKCIIFFHFIPYVDEKIHTICDRGIFISAWLPYRHIGWVILIIFFSFSFFTSSQFLFSIFFSLESLPLFIKFERVEKEQRKESRR
jgi:hypothetical protein